jgi:hypothetical protein
MGEPFNLLMGMSCSLHRSLPSIIDRTAFYVHAALCLVGAAFFIFRDAV